MFRDEQRDSVWEQIRQRDLLQFASILTPQVLADAAQRAQLRLGTTALNLSNLVWLAVSSALRPGMNFCRVLSFTLRLLQEMESLPAASKAKRRGRGRSNRRRRRSSSRRRSRHDPRVKDPTHLSEEAFAQARKAMPPGFWVALILLLGEIFQERHGQRWGLWKGFRLLALDGTCITLPKYKTLGEHFGYAKNKHGIPRPQARLVMLHLPLVRLPWRYELAPRDQGESTLAKRLLNQLQRDDLVLMDRGFFHFDLFQQIQQAQAFFAIRLIKGPRFQTLRRLGHKDRLVLWRPVGRRWQGASIELRVIDYQVKGFRPSAIVSNLTNPARVSRQDFVGLADSRAWVSAHDAGLYHRRWEIETSFREIKRVQQMAEGLRGRTREAIEYEVHGHMLLYLLTRWLMVEAAEQHGKEPLRLSFTAALAEIVFVAPLLPISSPRRQRRLIRGMLRHIADANVPLRPGRHYPRPNDGKMRSTGAGHVIPSSVITA